VIELLHQTFVLNAVIAGTLIAITAAIIGYFAVLRAQAFATHALSHIGFAGATLAVLLGTNQLAGTLGFTVATAFGMGALGTRIKGRDIEIGMILSLALGLGVLFLRLYTGSSSEAAAVLFGSIFSVTETDIIVTVCLGFGTLIVLAIIFRPLLFVSIDPEVAEARGVPLKALSMIFILLLAITVAAAIQIVGVLIVFALIIAPAAAAQHLSRKPSSTILLSVLFGLVFTWGGLLLSLISNYPVSFYIAGVAAITYFIAMGCRRLMLPRGPGPQRYSNREEGNERLSA
jgi:zinc/manganese transport system permease protein